MAPFRMVVDEVWWLTGRPGPIVTGATHAGECAVGDALDLVDETGERRGVVVRGVELIGVGRPPASDPPLNLRLGDDLAPDDVRPGLVLESRE